MCDRNLEKEADDFFDFYNETVVNDPIPVYIPQIPPMKRSFKKPIVISSSEEEEKQPVAKRKRRLTLERALSLTPPPVRKAIEPSNECMRYKTMDLDSIISDKVSIDIKDHLLLPIQPTTDSPSLILELKCVFKLKDQPELKPFKARVKDTYPFSKILDIVSKKAKRDLSTLVLVYRGVKLFSTATPKSMRLTSEDVIEIHDAMDFTHQQSIRIEQLIEPKSNASLSDEEEIGAEAEYLLLKLQDEQSDSVKAKIKASSTILTLKQFYVKSRKLDRPIEKVRLLFDGEELCNEDTLVDVGVESDDMIEVRVSH